MFWNARNSVSIDAWYYFSHIFFGRVFQPWVLMSVMRFVWFVRSQLALDSIRDLKLHCHGLPCNYANNCRICLLWPHSANDQGYVNGSLYWTIGCFFLNICLIINILVEFQKFRNINCIDLVAQMYHFVLFSVYYYYT